MEQRSFNKTQCNTACLLTYNIASAALIIYCLTVITCHKENNL